MAKRRAKEAQPAKQPEKTSWTLEEIEEEGRRKWVAATRPGYWSGRSEGDTMSSMIECAEEALLSAAMSASDAGMPLEEAVERVKAAYAQAATERGEADDHGNMEDEEDTHDNG